MESKIAETKKKFTDTGADLKVSSIDMTLPGSGHSMGAIHPISLVQMELEEIFMSMGFYGKIFHYVKCQDLCLLQQETICVFY